MDVLIDDFLFNSSDTDQVTIQNIEIIEDCMTIEYSASGCDGESWEVKLINSDSYIYTYPPSTSLKLVLKNEEFCKAYLQKKQALTFQLKE
ncbi:MAG: hypothetical protein V3V14_10980 [Saprospiraceae bacterium]